MRRFRFAIKRILATAAFAASVGAYATPPSDPICRAPNSLELIAGIREQITAEATVRRRHIGPQQPAARPQLSIEVSSGTSLPRLIIGSTPGRTFHLEVTSDLSSAQWNPWLSGVFGEQPVGWNDDSFGGTASRFFRLRV